ncbi:MAG: Rv3235 family protein, partial [Pseudonocardia sp.]|nr:Rv3235 family protein [Pseudonocardia sp.]
GVGGHPGPLVTARTGPAVAPARSPGAPAARRPHALAGALVRSMLEVLAGRRRPVQLVALVAPEVLRYLTAASPSTVRAVAPGRVHVRQPHPDAAEVVAVCRVGDRIRALTLRLDARPAAGSGGASGGATAGPGRATGGPGDRDETVWICTAVRLL